MGFKSVFKTAFPFIMAAASAGGPLALMVAAHVGKALGVDKVDATPEGIEAAIATAQIKDPEAMMKLQAAEQSFQIQMQQLGFDHVEKLEEINAADRASARAREMVVRDKLPAILALTLTAGFFGVSAFVMSYGIAEAAHDVVLIMIGALASNFNSVISYYFGSSSGSAAKTEIMADQAKGG